MRKHVRRYLHQYATRVNKQTENYLDEIDYEHKYNSEIDFIFYNNVFEPLFPVG